MKISIDSLDLDTLIRLTPQNKTEAAHLDTLNNKKFYIVFSIHKDPYCKFPHIDILLNQKG